MEVWEIVVLIVMVVVVLVGGVFMFFKIRKLLLRDFHLFLEKDGRFNIVRGNLPDNKLVLDKKTFIRDASHSYINRKGTALNFYTSKSAGSIYVNPFKNEIAFISPEMLTKIIDEHHVQLLTEKQGGMKDMIIIYGALGGIIAGIASVIILLRETGMLTGGA